MAFLISNLNSDQPQLHELNELQKLSDQAAKDAVKIHAASDLLDLYLETDESSPLMPCLVKIRASYLEDLDSVATVPEIYGLMYWLLQDYGIDNRGESLEETADRLGDLDIENDTDQFTDLIFHLKDAVERLYDLELE